MTLDHSFFYCCRDPVEDGVQKVSFLSKCMNGQFVLNKYIKERKVSADSCLLPGSHDSVIFLRTAGSSPKVLKSQCFSFLRKCPGFAFLYSINIFF